MAARSGRRTRSLDFDALVGCERARLSTPPLRKLTRRTSRGFEVAEFAELVLGEPLLPWQRWLAVHALELLPDGAYRFRTVLGLCGRQNGKSNFWRTLALWRIYVDGARLVLGTAHDLLTARTQMLGLAEVVKSVPALRVEFERVAGRTGDEQVVFTGARYRIAPATASAGRGLSVDLLGLDELRVWREWAPWSALSKTTMARPAAQTWAITSQGDERSVVLNHLRDAALSGRDPSIGLFEWSAPDGCDLDDPRGWAAANPGLGHTVSVAAIRSALGTDPPAVFRNEVLCQRVEAMDGAMDLAAWRDCADPRGGGLERLRDRVVAGLDVAPDGAHVSLVAAAVAADGRVRLDVKAAWASTQDARVDLAAELAEMAPVAVVWFPGGPAAALGLELRGLAGAVEVKGGEVGEACQAFADLVAARRVVHPGDPLLDAHVAGAKRHDVGDGWRFVRRGAGHVDAVYAAAGAAFVARALAAAPGPVSSAYEERGLVTL